MKMQILVPVLVAILCGGMAQTAAADASVGVVFTSEEARIIASWDDDDIDAKQVGPRLAELQGLTQITDVCRLVLQGDQVVATRRWEKDHATVQAPWPALISVAPDAYQPRYMHAVRIMNAYQDGSVVVWNSEDLEIQPADLTPVLHFRGQSFAPVAPTGELLRGNPEEVAHELASVLKYEFF